MSDIQPTGILARVMFFHEQGARLEVVSQRSRIDELGVRQEEYDKTTVFKVGTKMELYGKNYEILSVSMQFMPRLNSATIPEIDPATYFTDESEQLPNNLFIQVVLRPV